MLHAQVAWRLFKATPVFLKTMAQQDLFAEIGSHSVAASFSQRELGMLGILLAKLNSNAMMQAHFEINQAVSYEHRLNGLVNES